MKKSIFLFFAAILCAMTANAQWYLMGTVTDWGSGKQMTGDSEVVSVTINLTANTTYELKIKNGSSWYGNGGTMSSTNNLAWEFSSSNNSNAKITTKDAGDYTFTWYISDKKLSVTYPNHNYIVAGDGDVMEDNWSPSSTKNKMEKQDDGTYRLTKTNRSLSAKTYGYKLTVGSWDVNQYPKENVALEVTTAGNYNVVFTYNPKNGQLSHELVPIYTITASANPATAGTITGAGTYAKDASVTLEATPNAGYKFVNWTVGGVEKSTETTYSFTASADITAVANFELSDPEVPTYAISVSANDDAMGTVTGAGDYTEGSPVTLTATPNAGYRFVNWTVAGAEVSTANPYTFTANTDITVTANFEEIPKETVYFVNNGAWAGVSIYGWGGSVTGTGINKWSGVPMTKTGETLTVDGKNYDIYSYSAEVGAVKNILFNYNGDENKTSDFVWRNGNYYYFGAAKDFDGTTKEGVVTALSTPLPDETVYFVNNKKWDGVSIYGWGGTASTSEGIGKWAGVAMTKTAEQVAGFDVYLYTAKQGSVANILFNYNGDENKSANFVWTNGKYYYMGAAANYAGGTKEEVATALATPVPTYDYYVIGTINNWGLEDAAYGMELNGEVYEKQVTLAANQKHELKINNGKWENENTFGYDQLSVKYEGVSRGSGEGDNNIVIELTENKTITIKLDKNTKKVTLDGLTESTAPTQYYVVGTFTENWTNAHADYELTLDGEVYKKSLTLDAGEHMFKITDGTWNDNATWGYGNITGSYVEIDEGTNNEGEKNGNIKVTLAAQKTFTVIFDATAGKITFDGLTPYVTPLTYTVIVPPGTEKCYIAGNMNGWAFQEMEAVTGETNKFTITIVGAKETDEYKYACQADWAYAEVIEGGGNRTTWSALDEVTAWNKPVVYTYYLMGIEGDWTTGIEMEVNTDAENEVMLTCQPVNGEVKIKRLGDDASEHWYGAHSLKAEEGNLGTNTSTDGGDGNILLEEGIYNFYFNTADGKLWIAAATDCEPTPDYTRTVGNNQFGTICLPFGGTITGAVLYQCVGRETGKVYLGSVNTLTAGVPYIFQATATELAVYSDGTTAAAGSSNGLHGTFDDETVVAVGNYILLGNALRPSNGEAKVNANRAYLVMSEVPAGKPQEMPGRRYIGMSVQGENVETGVEDIITTDAPVKVIENGQLIIIRDGVKYNVQGQKL